MEKKQLSILDAFIALEDIEDEDFNFTLNEGKAFNIRDVKEMEEAEEFLDSQDKKEVELEVIDADADAVEHLKNKEDYIGDFLIRCNVCRSTRCISPDKLVVSEEDETVYNVEDECPHCHKQGTGYTLIGQVGAVVKEEEPKIENDSLTATEEEEPEFDNDLYKEPEETEEVKETEETEVKEEPSEEENVEVEETEEDSLTSSEEDNYEEPLTTIEDEKEEKEETKESIKEEVDNSLDNVKDLFDNIVEYENIDDLVIYDLESENPEEEIYSGSASELPEKGFESEFISFNVGDGSLLINIDTKAEATELDKKVSDILKYFNDDFNTNIGVWDANSGEEVFSGTKESVLKEYGDEVFLSIEAPERLELAVRKFDVLEGLKTPYNEDLDLADPEDKLIHDILRANNIAEYKLDKYGSEAYWIADSVRNLEDLDHIWNNYISDKTNDLILEFKDVTGYKTEGDLVIEKEEKLIEDALTTEEEDALVKDARALLKNTGAYAVIYSYTKNGKVYKLPELVLVKDAESYKDKIEIINLRFHPTGSIRALYRDDASMSVDFKNRKDLSEAVLECESKGINYTITRSQKEGYRYTLTKEIRELNEEVEETADVLEVEATEEPSLVDAMDERDIELACQLNRIAHDITQAIRDFYGVEADERAILVDMIQDLNLISGKVSIADLESSATNDLTKQLFNAYNGFYNALDELKSFETGEEITTTTAEKIRQGIASLASKDFTREGIRERIKDPSFLASLKRAEIPGINYDGLDLESLTLLDDEEETEEEVTEAKHVCSKCGKFPCECLHEEHHEEENSEPEDGEEFEFDELVFENFINNWYDDNCEDTRLFECLSGGIREDGVIVLEGKLLEENKVETVSFTLTPVINEDLLDSKKVTTYTITSTDLPQGLIFKK